MATSGADAAPGAWPANAAAQLVARIVHASSVRFGNCLLILVSLRLLLHSRGHVHVHAGGVVFRGGRGYGLGGRRRRRRNLLADRELHGRDLLHLVDDDFLSDATQLLVLA